MVEFLTIQKEKRPISISYYALKKFKEETGHTFDDIQAKVRSGEMEMEMEYFEILLYHGLVAGAKLEKQKFDEDREFAEFLLDDCFWDFIELFPKFFPDAEMIKKPEVSTSPKNRQQRRAVDKKSVGRK